MALAGRQAVVIGAGIAGLAAARVLADRFDRVVLVDRDALPDGPATRRGVPQGGHAHGLLATGRNALEELFPGLTDELVGEGALVADAGMDTALWQLGGYRTRFDSGIPVLSLSRALLENRIRMRVAALPNVEVRPETAVGGLTGVGGERVTGVTVDGGGELAADLVVDASGRSAVRSARWLAGLGFPAPEVDEVRVGVAYATRLIRRRPDERVEDVLLLALVETPPDATRFGVVTAIEGDRWLVTLGGWHGDHPPGDEQGFAAFAATLPRSTIADLLDRAEPVTDVYRYQFQASRRRYFERLRRVPAGYVALGDAICSFNPVYGQGMTVAALEAMALGRCVDRHPVASVDLARAYYRQAAKVVSIPWRIATNADFAYRQTQGPKPFGVDLLSRYVRRVERATHVSTEVHRAIVEVQHMLAPPWSLMMPRFVARVVRANRRLRAAAPAEVGSGTEPVR